MNATAKASSALEGFARAVRLGQQQAGATGRAIVVSSVQHLPWPLSPLATLAAVKALPGPRAFWARPSEVCWLVGVGEAASVSLSGPDAIGRTQGALRSLMSNAVLQGPARRGVGPIFLGGFRFDPLSSRDAAWGDFPDALLVLPRLLFTWAAGEAWLTVNLRVEPGTDIEATTEGLLETLENLARGGAMVSAPPAGRQPPSVVAFETPRQKWASALNSALDDIGAGRLSKVVLAKKRVLLGEEPFSAEVALARLQEGYPDCAIFAIERGDSTLLGATPEPLARLDEGVVTLSCLAGTTGRGSTPEEDRRLGQQLQASAKDQREHAAVVEAVSAALLGVCQELCQDPQPRLVRLKGVQHLATAFRGRILEGRDLLDLAAALHPTPAVGGVPKAAALAAIRAAEGDRGWYGAPVGWIDHRGQGELYIALRSALLQGSRATLYAGAGIVDGSDPDGELQEADMKLQPMMRALGQEPA
ncbi:MAG: isochorismate synthase [Chloroflexi bacterium]|nr:isochorismate synthase [Chloroflexota bacterium]